MYATRHIYIERDYMWYPAAPSMSLFTVVVKPTKTHGGQTAGILRKSTTYEDE